MNTFSSLMSAVEATVSRQVESAVACALEDSAPTTHTSATIASSTSSSVSATPAGMSYSLVHTVPVLCSTKYT